MVRDDNALHGADRDVLHVQLCRGDALMTRVLAGLLVVCLGLAFWHGTWMEAVLIGLPALLVPVAIARAQPGGRLGRVAMALGLMVFCALMIHQSLGMIEFHFPIFALLAVLLYYRDWLPIVAAAALIAVHHLVFAWLQMNAVPVYAFERGASFELALLHAVFVVVEVGILAWMAVDLRRQAVTSAEVSRITRAMTADNDMVDLRVAGPIEGRGNGARLSRVILRLQATMADVREAAEALDSSGGRLVDLSSGMRGACTEQQVGVEQLHGTLEAVHRLLGEVEVTAQAVSTNAQATERELRTSIDEAAEARTAINALSGRIDSTRSNVDALTEASGQIGSVIDVIQGIAEQTNLLALNAAIEAARAGEQGRGFAVVADEVRTLAQRTRQSTEEIREVIAAVQDGASRSGESMRSSLEDMATSVTTVDALSAHLDALVQGMSGISAQNRELAAGATRQLEQAGDMVQAMATLRDTAGRQLEQAGDVDEVSRVLGDLASQLAEHTRPFRT